MVLAQVPVHVKGKEAAACRAGIRKTEGLPEPGAPGAQGLEATSDLGRCPDSVEHALNRRVDGIRKSSRRGEIEQVYRIGSIRPVTEDAVLPVGGQDIAGPRDRTFIKVKSLVVEKEMRNALTGIKSLATFAESREREWPTETPAELIQAKLALGQVLIIVLEVGRVKTFVAMLPERGAPILVRSATRGKIYRDRAVA